MRDAIQIRPALPHDAAVAAALLYSAYTHTEVTYPIHDPNASGFLDRLQHYFRQVGNRFSYEYSHVATVEGAGVVGLVLSFGGRDEAQLNAAVGRWVEREANDDEWYVDALAVLQNWGRSRIATSLLRSAEQQARQQRYAKIALRVAEGNQRELDLYLREHYEVAQQTVLYQRPYTRLVKTLQTAP